MCLRIGSCFRKKNNNNKNKKSLGVRVYLEGTTRPTLTLALLYQVIEYSLWCDVWLILILPNTQIEQPRLLDIINNKSPAIKKKEKKNSWKCFQRKLHERQRQRQRERENSFPFFFLFFFLNFFSLTWVKDYDSYFGEFNIILKFKFLEYDA